MHLLERQRQLSLGWGEVWTAGLSGTLCKLCSLIRLTRCLLTLFSWFQSTFPELTCMSKKQAANFVLPVPDHGHDPEKGSQFERCNLLPPPRPQPFSQLIISPVPTEQVLQRKEPWLVAAKRRTCLEIGSG
jgi:hypothetical protein